MFCHNASFSLHARNVEAFSTFTSDERCRLFVTNDLLGLRIPFNLSTKSASDGTQVAGTHGLNVRKHVGHRQAAFGNAAVEVVLVTFCRLAFVKTFEVFLIKLILVPVLIDRRADDLAAVHKDAALRSFERDAVVTSAGHVHDDAIVERVDHREIVRRVVAVVDDGVTIFVFDRMFNVGPVDFDRTLAFPVLIESPHCNVDVMSTPVGELATGVFVPPAELVVATLLAVVDRLHLTLPHVPVEVFWNFGDREWPTFGAAVDADSYFPDVTKQPLLDHVDGSQKFVLCAPLLRTDQESLIGVFPAGVADQLVFFESQGQRLLTEDVLASLQRFNGDFHMPVIWSHDTDNIDVVSFQNLAVVAVGVRLTFADPVMILRSVRVFRINIANRQNVTEVGMLSSVAGAHAADADAADPRSRVGFVIGESGSAPREVWNGSRGRGERGCFQKVTAIS